MKIISSCLLFLLFAGLFPTFAAAQQPTAPLAEPQLEKAADTMTNSPGTGELFDIKGPIEIPDHTTTLLISIAVLLTTALVLLLISRWRKRPGRQQAIQAHEHALQQLTRAQRLLDDQNVDAFVTLMNNILRNYIEKRFAISARRQTTHEFISGLTRDRQAVPEPLANNSKNLQTWLEHCDLVKFARGTLNKETMEGMLANLRTFIESTRLETEK